MLERLGTDMGDPFSAGVLIEAYGKLFQIMLISIDSTGSTTSSADVVKNQQALARSRSRS